MTEAQKRVTTLVAISMITALSGLVIFFAVKALSGGLIGDQFSGILFLSLATNFADLATMLKALGGLVLMGVAFAGTACRSNLLFSMMTIAMLAGIIGSVLLLILVGSDDVAADLWGPSRVPGIETDEQLQASVRPLIIWIGGGLVAALCAFLGVSALRGADK